jgi:hypothetical protein
MVCAALCRVVNLRLGDPEAALQPLKKLHTLLPDQPEVGDVGQITYSTLRRLHAV